MTRLVFDAKNFYSRTGVPNYVIGFLETLRAERPDLELVALSQRRYDLGPLEGIAELRLEPSRHLARLPPNLWLKLCAGRLVEKDELFFAGSTLRPIGVPGRNTCAVVHDMNHVLVPETMTRGNRIAMRTFFRRDVATAAVRVCNSHGTRARLLRIEGILAEAVVHPRPNRLGELSDAEADAILAGIGLRDFVLFVGTLEPRKNLRLLLGAIPLLRERRAGLELAVAGARGWGESDLPKPEGVRHLGFVDNRTLHALYRRCRCFVLPSVYEGFGMPALEARLHGARVVCTDIPELREAGGDTGVYVRPEMEALVEGILRAIDAPFPGPGSEAPSEMPESVLGWIDRTRPRHRPEPRLAQ